MSSIRTNTHPTILTSCSQRGAGDYLAPNVILSYYRDIHDGSDSIRELLWTTQLLRVDYDSWRIGGGIDPDIATLGMGASLYGERMEPGSFANYLLGTDEEPAGAFEGHSIGYIQDCIVHAEAVALTWLAVFGDDT